MMRRGFGLSLALLVFGAAAAHPQGVVIDHKEVGCIVVGKYPKMNACFSPAADLARSRVYFRPEGVTSWYYVDMKSDQPCFSGTLPKPGKKLVGKKIEYYVEAQNKTFEPARTAEYAPIVVKSAQECKKNVPVAPFLNNATVAVFPSVPAGFVGGGIGTAAVVGIVGAGAAAATTAAVVASNNNDTTTTTLAVVINPTTTTTTTLAPNTTTTTLAPGATNKPPFAVLKVSPDPPVGLTPLTVTFDLCSSTDPNGDALSFFHDFGDGSKASGCLATHTYTATSFQGPGASRAEVGIRSTSYSYNGSVVDTSGASQTRERGVTVNVPTPTTTSTTSTTTTTTTTTLPPCPKPTVVLSPPPSNVSGCPASVDVQADTTNATAVTFCATPVDASLCGGSPRPPFSTLQSCGPGTPSGNTYSATLTLTSFDCYEIRGVATGCAGTATSGPGFTFASGCGAPPPVGTGAARTLAWVSDLSLAGARLQVVVNASDASYPGEGREMGTARARPGVNRVEATVAEASGKPGLWRFELSSGSGANLNVIAGDVAALTTTSVTFRLSGKAGERVSFTFEKD